ncbi:glycosyltransferase family 2 protein [Acinetobacter towneri]|uniref:glycosyltransferase family 2 protein n=1 Tax=Acinetobacter towneri TaxID=202956 RepID=UPI0014369935|nr:glycosyltransferase family 2 protein [Acinetobacter towneri]MCA4814601.1 glycosyltransferase family 2 protein [Acinetobacter towneri]QIV93373.1 glycosyltransferase [Acinetobacter towneri]
MVSDNSIITIVIVTFNRKELLLQCLQALSTQTQQPSKILIVDNSSTDGTIETLQQNGWLEQSKIQLIALKENMGGAGGFSTGMQSAFEQSAEYIWMMDDDGYPAVNCLEKLYTTLLEKKLDAISPVQININNHNQLAFPIWLNKKQIRGHVDQIPQDTFLNQEANLFNGLLIHRSVVEKIGLPRKEFFIRGDEVEYTKRFLKNNIKFGTLTSAKFYHPSDDAERVSCLFGQMVIRDAHSDFKNYYMFRNRAVAFIEDRNASLLPLDFIRYSYYFLIHKKFNWKGLKLWCTATYDGIRRRLGRHPKY